MVRPALSLPWAEIVDEVGPSVERVAERERLILVLGTAHEAVGSRRFKPREHKQIRTCWSTFNDAYCFARDDTRSLLVPEGSSEGDLNILNIDK